MGKPMLEDPMAYLKAPFGLHGSPVKSQSMGWARDGAPQARPASAMEEEIAESSNEWGAKTWFESAAWRSWRLAKLQTDYDANRATVVVSLVMVLRGLIAWLGFLFGE
jgi:hypothetical protein